MTTRTKAAFIAGTLAGLLLAATARGGTITVASDGVDGPTCGGKKTPCRSIGRAIANAGAGDKVIVGPGHYGDLNDDGTLGEAGEEKLFPPGTCGGVGVQTVVCIDKPIALLSRDGAATTVIDARTVPQDDTVVVTAPGASLGAAKKGFNVIGNPMFGNAVLLVGSGGSVVGNRITGRNGMAVDGMGHLVKGNQVSGAEFVGVGASGSTHQVVGNEIIDNGGQGISLFKCMGCRIVGNLVARSGSNGVEMFDESGGLVVEGNVATANGGHGFAARRLNDIGTLNVVFRGNLASRNLGAGFFLDGTNLTLTGNAAIGNAIAGVQIDTLSDPPALVNNNFIGNGGTDGGLCGVLTLTSQPVAATGSYWGAATGPGPRPADAACSNTAAAVVTEPFATKPRKVKPKLPRIQ
jgi:Periplasmic copper-binding protein (NosD)